MRLGYLRYVWCGTEASEAEWAIRHLRNGNDWGYSSHAGEDDEWVLVYWDSRGHSHRSELIDKISSLYPFDSVLEVGANCGPNLYLIAKKFPHTRIAGIDINERAIQKGKELFAAEGISNVSLSVAKADKMGQFADKSFDIVFTDAVLLCVGPDKINKIIIEMLRVSRKTLIFVEWHSAEETGKGHMVDPLHYPGRWSRDYVTLVKRLVPQGRIRVTKISKDMWPDRKWSELGAIIEISL